MIDIIFYVVYARLLLEAHENMILSSTLEIKELQSSTTAKLISHIIAWTFFLLCLLLPTISLYFFYSKRKNYDPKQKSIVNEFFADLKNTKWARFYTFALLARRVLFVCIIIFLSTSVDRKYIYYSLMFVQV